MDAPCCSALWALRASAGLDAAVPAVVEEVKREMEAEKGNPFTMATMAKIKNRIEGW